MQKYVTECMGTFFLALTVAFGNPIAVGLVLMAMIYVGAHISGGHYNPAISVAFFMRNRLRLEELGLYIVSQCLGASLAIWFFSFVTCSLYSPEVATEGAVLVFASMEGLLTFVFCLTALSVVLAERYRAHAIQGAVIGLTLTAIAFFGGIFNPAIAISALGWNMLKDGAFTGLNPFLINVLAPLIGGVCASYMYGFLNESKAQ